MAGLIVRGPNSSLPARPPPAAMHPCHPSSITGTSNRTARRRPSSTLPAPPPPQPAAAARRHHPPPHPALSTPPGAPPPSYPPCRHQFRPPSTAALARGSPARHAPPHTNRAPTAAPHPPPHNNISTNTCRRNSSTAATATPPALPACHPATPRLAGRPTNGARAAALAAMRTLPHHITACQA